MRPSAYIFAFRKASCSKFFSSPSARLMSKLTSMMFRKTGTVREKNELKIKKLTAVGDPPTRTGVYIVCLMISSRWQHFCSSQEKLPHMILSCPKSNKHTHTCHNIVFIRRQYPISTQNLQKCGQGSPSLHILFREDLVRACAFPRG